MTAAAPTDPRAARDEILPLTGLRGVAAAWVLVFHAGALGLWGAFPELALPRFAPQAGGLGYLGVDLFFLLSGFVLTWTYAPGFERIDARRYRRYLVVRLARVYPIHATVLLALGVVVAGGAAGLWESPWRGPGFGGGAFVLHAALVHSWGLGPWLSWNHPSWSVSAEWFTYLWFPFICPPLVRARRPAALVAVAALALLLVALIAPLLAPRPCLNVPQLGGLVRVTGEFVAGCCLCRAFVLVRDRRIPWGAISWISAAAIAALACAGRADPWALPFFGLLVVSLAPSQGGLARILSLAPVVLGGRVSYALYMVHAPVFVAVGAAIGAEVDPRWPLAPRLAWAAAHLVLPWGVAWAAWRWIEEPARRAIRARAQ